MALGQMEMGMDEFNALTPAELNQKIRGWVERQGHLMDNQLWQTRWLSAIILNSRQGVKKFIRPDELFRLPGERKRVDNAPQLSKEEVAERFKQFQQRLKKHSNGDTISPDKAGVRKDTD